MISCASNLGTSLRRLPGYTSFQPRLDVRELVQSLDLGMLMELDPWPGLDVCETVLALALSSEVFAPLEADVEDAVKALGLLDVPYRLDS